MKVVKEGKRQPVFSWAERYWRGGNCRTVVYLEDSDAAEWHDAYDQRESDYVVIVCPICGVKESYYPTADPDNKTLSY